MKLTQIRLRQIIKEELKKTLKEEKYRAKKGRSERWEPDEPEYERAVGRLERLERDYPVLVGALTKDPVRRDACIQELAAKELSARMAGMSRLGLEGELAALEEALTNTFNNPYYTVD